MKKVLIINQLNNGGIVHYTACLIKGLLVNDSKIYLLTSSAKDEEYSLILDKRNTNFKFLKILFPLTDNRFLKFIYLILNYFIIFFISIFFGIKNVHFQWTLSNVYDSLFVKILNFFERNTIFTIHNVLPHDSNLTDSKKAIFGRLYKSFRKIIVHNNFSKSALFGNFPYLKKENVSVINHGNYLFLNDFNSKISRDGALELLNLSKDNYYILFFGYIRDYKGLDLFLSSFKLTNKKIHLIIAGKCNDFSYYDDFIKIYKIEDRVHKFLEYIDIQDFAKYFYASDLVVFPYKNIYESGAIQSAFAFSKPVLTSNIEPFIETIENYKNGFYTDFNDPDGSSIFIDNIFYNLKDLSVVGDNGYEYVKGNLNWDNISLSNSNLYK